MALNFNDQFGPKRVEVIVAGERISPDRAQEIIRRTDTAFQKLLFPVSDYGRHVRSMLGFPSEIDGVSDEERRGDETKDAVARWRTRWDAVDLEWLGNHQLLYAKGWCHADGTIALADELEDYPRASELLADCQRLATAFPDLVMHVAAWGTGRSILGYPLMDAPESPWPQALLDSQPEPTFGFLIGNGAVEVVQGTDRRLFERFGLHYSRAVERTLSEMRRCAGEAVRETMFGDRAHNRGIPDKIIHDWLKRARSLGLVDEIRS
jgi:hypothetical protein